MYSANVLKGHLRQLSSWSNQSWMKYVRNCMEKNRRHSKSRPITGHSHGFGDQCSGINTWETRRERIHTLSHSHTVPHHRPSSPHFELLRWQGVNAATTEWYLCGENDQQQQQQQQRGYMQTTTVKHVVSHTRLAGHLDPADPSTAESTPWTPDNLKG